MATLASIEDYQTIIGPILDPGDAARIEGLLALASEAVLAGAHGQNITSQTYTAATIYNDDGRFWFPQRPVTAVASVTVDGVSLTAGTDYRFTPGGDGRPALLIRRHLGRDASWHCAEATVTYTAGWATVPAQIKAAVCATAQGVFQGQATSQLTVDQNGQAVEQFPSNRLALLAMKLPPATQTVIDGLTKVRGPASVEIGRG